MHDQRWVSAAFGAAVCAILILALSLPHPASAAGPYQLVGTATSRSGHLVRTETTVQVGADPLDRFRLYRLVQDGPAGGRLGSILLLPPLGPGYSFYEQRDPSGGVGTSITEYLALRGFDVYGYSARFEGLPAGACEAGVFDCSMMSTWDIQSMVEDIAFLRSEIERLHPGTPVVTGGASRVHDLSCHLAGLDDSHVANLGDFDGAVLAIGGEHGFGPYLADQAAMFGTADVTVLVTPGFGHIDHFMSPHHRDFVERPIAEWARRVLGD